MKVNLFHFEIDEIQVILVIKTKLQEELFESEIQRFEATKKIFKIY
ncbi:hypothetical protein [Mycoplasma hafezii]